jgi:regulator of replication initiation timing
VSDKARFSDSKEKFVIEIDTSKLTNTLIQLRVDALTKALWQYKLSLKQKKAVKDAIIKLIKEYAELKLPEPSSYNITINAVVPKEEGSESDIEYLTKALDITKRKLSLCEEENDTLKKENKKIKEYEDKLKEYEKKLKEIEKQIALWKQGTVTDPKQIINYIIKILSQA